MNWKKVILWTLGLLAVFGIAAGATYLTLERKLCTGCAMPGAHAAQQWTSGIQLTAEQKARLQPLDTQLENDLRKFQTQLAAERMDLCELMHQGATDHPAIEAKITRLGALEADQQRRLVRHFLAMRAILTPEQQDQFFTGMMHGLCENCRQSAGPTHSCRMCRPGKRA